MSTQPPHTHFFEDSNIASHPHENNLDGFNEAEPDPFHSDNAKLSTHSGRPGSIRFTGIFVARNDEIPNGNKLPSPESTLGFFAMEILRKIRCLMLDRPIITIRVLQELVNNPSQSIVEEALPYCGYMFIGGPWKETIICFGIDPRTSSTYRFYQTVAITMEFEPVIEPGKHEWPEKGALAFPQFLKGVDKCTVSFQREEDGSKW